MSDRREHIFPTKVDRWLVAVLATSLVSAVAAVMAAAREEPEEATFAGLMVGASFALVLALAVPTHYVIREGELVIRSGFIRRSIPLASIRRIYPTHNPLSAPAWSLSRLGIEYDSGARRGLALISPAAREEFLDLIARRAGLTPVGRELVRGR
ncbi:MAG TPA: PH domain-containing protein [Longimicrobiaceae bacterium]